MRRWLADVNFNGDLLRALRLDYPEIEVVRAQDVGLDEVSDDELLAVAAQEECLLLSHDKRTLLPAFAARVAKGLPTFAVVHVKFKSTIPDLVEEIALLHFTLQDSELKDCVYRLPL